MTPRLLSDQPAAAQASAALQAQIKADNAAHSRPPALELGVLEAQARWRVQAHVNASARLHSAEISNQFRMLRAQALARLTTIGARHAFAHHQATLRALVRTWTTP